MSRPQRWWHDYPGALRPVWVVAALTQRSANTIRTWMKNGDLTSACDVKTREVIVDVKEANELHKTKLRRRAGS